MNFKKFKEKYEHKPVEEYPGQVIDEPVVSVSVVTYNHMNYIKDCLEGILMQKTEFPFEILLGEDNSDDRTREICVEYAKKHPDKIRLFLHHRENNIKINEQPTGRFTHLYNFYRARGKYVALCEGDDYWTEPLKLQNQVNLLEKYPEYSLIVGGFTEIDSQTGNSKEIIQFRDTLYASDSITGYSFTLKDCRKAWLTQTLTAVYRRKAMEDLDYTQYKYFKDIHGFYHLLKKGKGFYITSVLGVYRMHRGGVYRSLSHFNKILSDFYTFQELYQINGDEHSRFKYLSRIKALLKYYRSHKVEHENLSRLSLLKTAFHLTQNVKQFLSVVKLSLPLINKMKIYRH